MSSETRGPLYSYQQHMCFLWNTSADLQYSTSKHIPIEHKTKFTGYGKNIKTGVYGLITELVFQASIFCGYICKEQDVL